MSIDFSLRGNGSTSFLFLFCCCCCWNAKLFHVFLVSCRHTWPSSVSLAKKRINSSRQALQIEAHYSFLALVSVPCFQFSGETEGNEMRNNRWRKRAAVAWYHTMWLARHPTRSFSRRFHFLRWPRPSSAFQNVKNVSIVAQESKTAGGKTAGRARAGRQWPNRRWRRRRATFSAARRRRSCRLITGATTPVKMSTSTTPKSWRRTRTN